MELTRPYEAKPQGPSTTRVGKLAPLTLKHRCRNPQLLRTEASLRLHTLCMPQAVTGVF